MVDGRGLVGEALRIWQASNHSSLPANRTAIKRRAKALNKTVFHDANCYACVAIYFSPVPDYSSLDCRTHTLKWTVGQFHYETDRR
jgi:hypothetical protein